MVLGNIAEHLPNIIPEETITVEDEPHEFVVLKYEDGTESTKYVYMLDKAPMKRVKSVTGTVDGSSYKFEQGTDYEVIDNDGDGKIDSIDFGVGGEQPDDNTEFQVTYTVQPIIDRYVDSHEETTTDFDQKAEDVIDSRQINNASGDELDRIGALFGELGKRRGRGDAEYRVFLKSIVQSFSGRGTVPGLKFAIAAGIGTDPENVEVIEDFTEVGYEIRIENVDTSFLSGVINELADLADPSGVELLAPPVIVIQGNKIYVSKTETTITASSVGLGGDTLTLDGNSTLG